MTTDRNPLVSVVIASVNGMALLGECLEHLVRQEGGHPYEVLVVNRCGEALRQDLKRRFPQPEIRVLGRARPPLTATAGQWSGQTSAYAALPWAIRPARAPSAA